MIVRACAYCGKDFQAVGSSKTCSERCRRLRAADLQAANRRIRSKKQHAELRQLGAIKRGTATPAPVVLEGFACNRCAHWEACPGADLGGQCAVARFTVCQPLRPGDRPFAPRGGVA